VTNLNKVTKLFRPWTYAWPKLGSGLWLGNALDQVWIINYGFAV